VTSGKDQPVSPFGSSDPSAFFALPPHSARHSAFSIQHSAFVILKVSQSPCPLVSKSPPPCQPVSRKQCSAGRRTAHRSPSTVHRPQFVIRHSSFSRLRLPPPACQASSPASFLSVSCSLTPFPGAHALVKEATHVWAKASARRDFSCCWASRVSTRASKSSTLATMRRCSARGGSGISIWRIFPTLRV
jgi:hypothetical protein